MDHSVIIIDGHPVYGEKLVYFLKGLTFKNIRLISSGYQALDQLDQEQPHLIILSSQLPDMDGQDICRELMDNSSLLGKMIVQVGLLADDKEKDMFKSMGVAHVVLRSEKDWQPLQNAIECILSVSETSCN